MEALLIALEDRLRQTEEVVAGSADGGTTCKVRQVSHVLRNVTLASLSPVSCKNVVHLHNWNAIVSLLVAAEVRTFFCSSSHAVLAQRSVRHVVDFVSSSLSV